MSQSCPMALRTTSCGCARTGCRCATSLWPDLCARVSAWRTPTGTMPIVSVPRQGSLARLGRGSSGTS
eukprot:3129284-Lingulodinium_polyedra.AAC.1